MAETTSERHSTWAGLLLIKYTANTFLFLCCFYFIFNGAFVFFKENIGTEIKDLDAYNFPLPSVAFCRNQGEGKPISDLFS